MPENGNGQERKIGAVGACPVCGKPAAEAYRPFCSKRCADVDLHRWLSGSYAIPVTEDQNEDGEEPAARDPENVKKPDEN